MPNEEARPRCARRNRRLATRLGPIEAVIVVCVVFCLASCSRASPARPYAAPASRPVGVGPVSIARGDIRLISGFLSPAPTGAAVYVDVTVVNDNPRSVALTGVSANPDVSPRPIQPHVVCAYSETVMTGSHSLLIGKATRALSTGARVRLRIEFRAHTPIIVELPVLPIASGNFG